MITVVGMYMTLTLQLWVAYGLFEIGIRSGAASLPAALKVLVGRTLLVTSLLLPFAMAWQPPASFFPAMAQIYSSYDPEPTWSDLTVVAIGLTRKNDFPELFNISNLTIGIGIALGCLVLATRVFRYLKHLTALQRRIKQLPQIRNLRGVHLRIGDLDAVPFSIWWPRSAEIVLPTRFAESARDFQYAVLHEFHHHRRRDTRWVHLLALLEALFPLSAVSLWNRRLNVLQELACDHYLVGRRNVPAQAYGRCLLWTAQSARTPRLLLVGTSSMMPTSSSSLLRERVRMLLEFGSNPRLSPQVQGLRRRRKLQLTVVIGCLQLLLQTGFALAARQVVVRKEVKIEDVSTLLQHDPPSAFPLQLNHAVLEQLNTFIANPKGQAFIQQGLERMPEYQAAIESRLLEKGLPRELLAIPLIESGFNNMPATSKEPSAAPGPRGAGIWMFISPTAQKFGLVVDSSKNIDDRLDPQKETEAAIALLSKLYKDFGSWELAIAAYNQGEKAVESALREHRTRDAWTLVQKGALNNYLATVMAGAIVIKHPELVP